MIFSLQPCGPFSGISAYFDDPELVETWIREQWGSEVKEIWHKDHKWRVHVVNLEINRDFWESYDLWPIKLYQPKVLTEGK